MAPQCKKVQHRKVLDFLDKDMGLEPSTYGFGSIPSMLIGLIKRCPSIILPRFLSGQFLVHLHEFGDALGFGVQLAPEAISLHDGLSVLLMGTSSLWTVQRSNIITQIMPKLITLNILTLIPAQVAENYFFVV